MELATYGAYVGTGLDPLPTSRTPAPTNVSVPEPMIFGTVGPTTLSVPRFTGTSNIAVGLIVPWLNTAAPPASGYAGDDDQRAASLQLPLNGLTQLPDT
jgi:hypothetical protein